MKKDKKESHIAVVDMEKIQAESRPAVLAREHLKKVQDSLQGGLDEVKTLYASAPEATSRRVMAEAQVKLQQQMAAEQRHASQVVEAAMLKAVAAWQETHPGIAVFPRGALLGASGSDDITGKVIALMTEEKVSFPDVPVVSVKKPEQAEGGAGVTEKPAEAPAAKAAGEKAAKKAADRPAGKS
ncbi:hypothetical protein QCK34_004532 [Enterobacter asburiae]|nr:hypothetical protein [Enterobacter asburiae]